MNFLEDIGLFELSLISIFFIFYFIYLVRIYRIGKQIKVNLKGVFIKFSLRILFFILLIISLLGPNFGVREEKVEVIGKDIMIAVDLIVIAANLVVIAVDLIVIAVKLIVI